MLDYWIKTTYVLNKVIFLEFSYVNRPECAELDAYSGKHSDRYPFMDTKTFCANCKVHCYRKDMQEKIQEVMRFSGPRMLFHRSRMAIHHMIETRKETKNTGPRG